MTGGQMTSMDADDCPLDIKEQFWKNVVAYEQAEQTTLFDRLVEAGVSLPPADEMNDVSLTAKLWEVFEKLSLLGAFLHHTNHLSDRELYDHLWTDSLRESTILPPDDSDFTCHVDLIGSGSERQLYLHEVLRG